LSLPIRAQCISSPGGIEAAADPPACCVLGLCAGRLFFQSPLEPRGKEEDSGAHTRCIPLVCTVYPSCRECTVRGNIIACTFVRSYVRSYGRTDGGADGGAAEQRRDRCFWNYVTTYFCSIAISFEIRSLSPQRYFNQKQDFMCLPEPSFC